MLNQIHGPRPRANAVASLGATGHVSPLARRPAGGAVQHAQRPGWASRSGPQAMSAGQVSATNAANARTRRAANQVAQLARQEHWRQQSDAQLRRRVESLPYSTYNANKMDPAAKVQMADQYGNPLGKEAYRVGQLWIFASTVNDAFGTRRYWVYNTYTKVLIAFYPERAIAADKQAYMPEGMAFRNTAAGTGVVGGYLEKGFIGLAAGGATMGLAYETGALWAVGTAVRAYYVKAIEGALTRAIVDLTTQFGVGTITGKGTLVQRAEASFLDINWLSVAGAAAVNSEGLKWYSKLLVAVGSSTATNAVSAKFGNVTKYGNFFHVVNLNDQQETKDFVVGALAGIVFDQVKEYAAPWLAKVMGNPPNELGRLAGLRYHRVMPRQVPSTQVDQSMVASLAFHIGGALETIKKTIENHYADQRDAEKAEAARKKAAARRSALPAARRP